MRPQCQKQVGVRRTVIYNAVAIPHAVICPHFAEPGSKWCKDHQEVTDEQDHRRAGQPG